MALISRVSSVDSVGFRTASSALSPATTARLRWDLPRWAGGDNGCLRQTSHRVLRDERVGLCGRLPKQRGTGRGSRPVPQVLQSGSSTQGHRRQHTDTTGPLTTTSMGTTA